MKKVDVKIGGRLTDKAEWLARLEEGDRVLVRSTHPWRIRRLRRVARFTKTLIVADDGLCFRRKDGHTPGEVWPAHWIDQITPVQARKAKR